MSRICVKNLPKYAGEDRLREHFSQKGEVTDAKLMRTRDGKSRQFAFIGYRTDMEAEEAIKFFNNSYIDTCRITCEVARKVGDPNIPRPWSRYTAKKDDQQNEKNKDMEGIRAKTRTLSDSREKDSKSSADTNPQLQEFLEIMQPRVKSKLWANDSLEAPLFVDKNGKSGDVGAHLLKGCKNKPTQMQPETSGGSDRENELDSGTSETTTMKKLNELAQEDAISDMDYFKSRVKKNWMDSEADADESSGGEEIRELDAKEVHPAHTEEAQKHAGSQQADIKELSLGHSNGENSDTEPGICDENDQALDTGRLFVRNLPYTTNEDELLELFSKFGDVSQVHLVVDKDTKRSKGICYVLYTLPESAVRALEELDSSIFQGRLLHVMPAKPQNLSTKKLESDLVVGQSTKSFKQLREDQRKASEVSGDTGAWNSLFMRPDTVVENVARKYGISKSDFLDREADDLAVRIALGETHVIAETKKALSSAGVNITALEEFAAKKIDNVRRSNHVILVKNLPYSSSEGDLTGMFGKFGSLDKIILPPTKTLALVIFLEAAEARAAFKGLAYKRYKDAPLYLEWAPGNVLSLNPTSETNEQNVVGKEDVKRVLLDQSMEGVSEVDIDHDRVEARSLFVKNLNFKTSDECLKKHFTDNIKNGRIQSVKVMKHNKNGKNLSMGYGFIEFDSVETATDVCRDLQGTILDGHALILQLCRAKKDQAKKVEKDMSSTKLLVRNVAFEATKKDLRQLFSPFGQIKSLRLPMKFSSHRGFAFVEYVTKQEAQNALQALSNTHLYGRHLVLEKAKEGETLEELQARTAAQFADKQSGFQLSSKKRQNMSIVDEGKIKFQRIMD